MNAYCDRQSVDFNSIAFLFDGRRLRGEQTPDEVYLTLFILSLLQIFCFSNVLNSRSSILQLDMEDGDEIDAMLHQTGGGGANGLNLLCI